MYIMDSDNTALQRRLEMRRVFYSFLLVALAVLFLEAIAFASGSEASSVALTSGFEDQTGVAITIYNVNLGLVKDQREIKLPKRCWLNIATISARHALCSIRM